MRILIGFICYGDFTAKYLPFFLPSLKNQTNKDYKIIAFNNGEADDANARYLRTNFPEIEIMGGGKNLGFAAAYNRLIARARDERAEYFLMTNPDVIFEQDVLGKLVQRLRADNELGSVCPKILKWDFSAEAARAKAEWPQASGGSPNPAPFDNNPPALNDLLVQKVRDAGKTQIVDTYGIGIKSGLRFFDVGQGKKDDKKFRYARIVGPSGACGLFRMAALEKVKENGQYLDERMFMYKEDCDLDYRLYLIHQESACVPEAVVYHDRTAAGAGDGDLAAISARKNKSREVKRLSLANQQLIFKKYWHLQDFLSRFNIILFEIKVFIFLLIFEWFLFPVFFTIFNNDDKISSGK